MKKINFVAILLFSGLTVFGQAVKDRNVIPVAVNLNEVLRMTISNGGNIEFVFNTINDYKNGLSAATATTGVMYETDFTVASSSRWKLTYGAETTTFQGTDDPTHTLLLNNVGFALTSPVTAAHKFETALAKATTVGKELFSAPTQGGTKITALQAYPIALIEDNDQATAANAGDASDNTFKISWRCGTKELGAISPMNAVALIDQAPSPAPDRYVANVLFDLSIDN